MTLQRLAKDIMTRHVITVEKGTSVHEIYKIFMKNNIMGVPVVDKEGYVVGIVTERDLAVRSSNIETPASVSLLGSVIYLDDIDHYNQMLKKKLGELAVDVMTSPVFTLKEDATLAEIIEYMDKHKVNRIPVVNHEDRLVGIVTRTDIIKELIKEKLDN